MYVKTSNGVVEKFPYAIVDLKNENPTTSFPHVIGNELLKSYGVFAVSEQPMPQTDRFSYCVKRHLPELIDGEWVIVWDVIQKTEEAIAEKTELQKVEIRDSRNGKLSACDWTQLPDAPISAEKKLAWGAYRQALRDVPLQAGFPWDVVWPTKPEV